MPFAAAAMPADAAPSSAPASSQRRLGPWVLERRLGSGAMGEVWYARHAVTNGPAAVKRLHAHVAARSHMPRFFARERRALARLTHPHLLRLYELGPDWIAMQYVEGSNLAQRLQTPMNPALAVAYALQVASALEHAHRHGVVHRDVKPANILVDGRDNAYLADFGLALFLDEDDATDERAGTPSFMSPEQARGRATPASDQYAFGRTLLEMLCGETVPTDPEAAVAQLPPELPASIADALRRATARAPEQRWPSMAALAEALAALDLRAYPAPMRLAPELRVRTGFQWCTAPREVSAVTPDITRADYRLGELAAAGLLPEAACRAFRAASGYDDLAWSLYGHGRRIGPITQTSAFARAADVVVILARDVLRARDDWHEVATTVSRDNAQAVILVPDLFGCGDTVVDARRVTKEQLSGAGIVRGALGWLDLLGLRDLPKVLVGHSISGAALLCVTDDELGERTMRVAFTPMCPPRSRVARALLRVYAVLVRLGAGIRPLRRLLGTFLRRWPDFQYVSDEVLAHLDAEFQRADPRVLGHVAAGFARTTIAPASALERCCVVLSEDDPIAPPDVILRTLRDAGFPDHRIERLVGLGHHPVFASRRAIEDTVRNRHDVARMIDAMLASSRDGAPSSTVFESTVIAAGGREAVT